MKKKDDLWVLVPNAIAGCLILVISVAFTLAIVAGSVWVIREVF